MTQVPDEGPLRDLIVGGLALNVVLVAHEAGLFEALQQPATIADLATATDLPERSVEAALEVARAHGLVVRRGGEHALSATGSAFLLRDSPTTFEAYLHQLRDGDRFRLEHVREALRSGVPAPAKPATVAAFTAAMHDRGRAAARRWPSLVDLGAHRRLLDVGGGSGVHAIGAVRRWPHLRAVVLDRPDVVPIAERHVAEADLTAQIEVVAGDYEGPDPFPAADVHLCSEVLHNRSTEGAARLVRRCADALPSGGLLLVLEQLLDEERRPAVAGAFANMALWTREGRQHRTDEVLAMVADAGLVEPTVLDAGGHLSLVIASHP